MRKEVSFHFWRKRRPIGPNVTDSLAQSGDLSDVVWMWWVDPDWIEKNGDDRDMFKRHWGLSVALRKLLKDA